MTTHIDHATLNNVNLEAVGGRAAIHDAPEKGQTTWHADVTWKGAFRSEATIRDFAPIASDEPVALGGSDTAPNPVEQLLAALGNCLAVGYAANASAKGIEIKDLRLELAGDLDLHSFLGLKPGHAGYHNLQVKVHLDAAATDEQIAELHRAVVDTSPVGHTLGRAIPLSIDLA